MNFTCTLCPPTDNDIDAPGLEGIVDHMRVIHPGQYEEPERWADGGIVVTDETAFTVADAIGGGHE